MTAPAYSSYSTKVLSIDHTFFGVFSSHFFPFIIDNYNWGSFFRKGIKMKIYLPFTIICPKILPHNNLLTHVRENIDYP